jgi:hypothetical protein
MISTRKACGKLQNALARSILIFLFLFSIGTVWTLNVILSIGAEKPWKHASSVIFLVVN